jgi:exodeoxyribonuclease-5
MNDRLTLSEDQDQALRAILGWYDQGRGRPQTLTLGGYAGTGKTSLISELCERRRDLRIALVSLTGKAVSVLGGKIRAPNAALSTIHGFLYVPVADPKTGQIIGWERRERGQIGDFDLVINDEASMTSDEIYRDLLRYGAPTLFVGDHGQLPPVKSDFNLMADPEIRLERIHRQAEGNPIVALAAEARTMDGLPEGDRSETVRVGRYWGQEDQVVSAFIQSIEDSLIIVATNRKRVSLNLSVCAALRQWADPFVGARLICLRNDRDSGLYNGAMVTLTKILSEPVRNAMTVEVTTDVGERIRLSASLSAFNQESPVLQRHGPVPFDFGYAVTCHKAQGSEARRVFVVGQGFGDAEMRRRWMYTAVTRAREELYVYL